MPKRETGVYPDSNGGYYWKANAGLDPFTGKARQVLRRGYKTARDAAAARRAFMAERDAGRLPTAPRQLTVHDLGQEYLGQLRFENKGPKTIASHASNL
jgi:hypothetical protein